MRHSSTRARKRKKRGANKSTLIIAAIIALVILLGAGCGFIGATISNLPDVQQTSAPAASSQVFDIKGRLITTIHAEENRLPVSLDQVPENLQHAFLAAEDIRFYDHHGIDPRGIMRAVFANITHNGIAQGGSTITQQLARNAFLTQNRTLERKFQEAILALQIEREYTKPEILEMYMNQIYFGEGAYGIQTAANIYFGKTVSELDLAQCALLAGLPQSPNYYSPFSNLEAAKTRQATVLNQMAKYGFISQEDADAAKAEDLGLRSPESLKQVRGSRASYFISYIEQVISDKYDVEALYKEGLKIYTTLDLDMQEAAERSLEANLPDFYTDANGLRQPQGAIVAIDPHNGHILAMVGGRGTDHFNRATQAVRQPGSAFKPFVYIGAVEKGMTPGTIVDDSPITIAGWSPQNYSRTFSGKMTLRQALINSVNVPAVKVAQEVGMHNILANAENMGISTLVFKGGNNDDNLAAALGGLTQGVIPLDMASAYGVLANGGVHVEPQAIIRIVDRNGNVLEENTAKGTQVISQKTAYIVTNMLESAVLHGTGGNAYIGRPMAGKTGTTDDTKDAWFVGYTPDVATAVWIGDDFDGTLQGLTGGTVPAAIWRDFMNVAVADMPATNFPTPPGVEGIAAEGFYQPAAESDKKDKDKDSDKKDKDGQNKDKKSSAKSADNDGNEASERVPGKVKGAGNE
ncbi:MAG: penicillin-binding protein 1A [Negativicoccus succinicivorans]|uniref:transglycosylase domain-containing protein n=1 Tax=Negativicoccus succinicivorans TaxID=620903 RepID=UPI00290B5F05|nr:penicillin-binding protein 1A [Negativicoccus succinicivorans]MDU5396195.1 penicillin-binding protein 1A [Negativicoccus succinicivorans]